MLRALEKRNVVTEAASPENYPVEFFFLKDPLYLFFVFAGSEKDRETDAVKIIRLDVSPKLTAKSPEPVFFIYVREL